MRSSVASRVWKVSTLAGMLACAALVPQSASAASVFKVGNVYTETNDPAGNQIVAWDRLPFGTLANPQRVDTGGLGAPSAFNCGFPPIVGTCAITDSQGAISLSPARTLLFAVNAGSNTVSSFRITPSGPVLVDQIDSGGDFPVSLDNHGRVLYVLNQSSGTIAGFKFTSGGIMSPIAGSIQATAGGAGGNDGQISFDPPGRNLVVTEPGADLIDTFKVQGGVAGPVTATSSANHGPFGFAFGALSHLVVTEAGLAPLFTGNVSTYDLTSTGNATLHHSAASNGAAPCWIAITPDGRTAFVANLVSKTIARFRLGIGGAITLLGLSATPNVDPTSPVEDDSDLALSSDGRFLYEAIPSGFGGPTSRVDAWRVGPTGGLTFLASTPEVLPAGISGIAAY